MAAQRGFCPYCAHVNPPDFKFCVNCQRKLPQEVLGKAAEGPASVEELNAAAGDRPIEAPEPPPPKSARWVILILTIGVALVVLVASYFVVTHYITGTSPNQGPVSTNFAKSDLCQAATGAGCKGSVIQLPYTSSGGLTQNVSSCLAVNPAGNSPRLLMNYTTTSKILGVLIPQAFYQGASVSYFANPSGFYNNSTAVSEAAWNSGPVLGGNLVNASIPAGASNWCIAFWAPSDTQSGTITLTADLYLLTPA